MSDIMAQLIAELDELDAMAVTPQQKIAVSAMPVRVTLTSHIDGAGRSFRADVILNPDHTWDWASGR